MIQEVKHLIEHYIIEEINEESKNKYCARSAKIIFIDGKFEKVEYSLLNSFYKVEDWKFLKIIAEKIESIMGGLK